MLLEVAYLPGAMCETMLLFTVGWLRPEDSILTPVMYAPPSHGIAMGSMGCRQKTKTRQAVSLLGTENRPLRLSETKTVSVPALYSLRIYFKI